MVVYSDLSQGGQKNAFLFAGEFGGQIHMCFAYELLWVNPMLTVYPPEIYQVIIGFVDIRGKCHRKHQETMV